MTDVADNGFVFHLAKVPVGHNVAVSGRCYDHVHTVDNTIQALNLVTVHGGLQCADRINLCNNNTCTGTAKTFGSSFADISVTADDGYFAGHHNIGCTTDRING